jgi:hypothetical protein
MSTAVMLVEPVPAVFVWLPGWPCWFHEAIAPFIEMSARAVPTAKSMTAVNKSIIFFIVFSR